MADRLGYGFRFAQEDFIARPSGALWWPRRQMLVVADLHLGRSARYVRRGGALLPPYETADTLARLSKEISALDPRTVVSLRDGFDDPLAAAEMRADHRAQLALCAKGREWIWIFGNHDPGPIDSALPGLHLPEIAGLPALRHEAASGPDISGHLHPSTRLAGKRWRCFVKGEDHLILPAFGTYTGGLDIAAPPLADLAAGGIAILCAATPFARPLQS